MNMDDTVPCVTVTRSALKVVAREAAQSTDGLETGGILLGLSSCDRLLIRHAGGPGPNAQRAPHEFHRDLQHAQALADAAWRKDRSQWIGEWHTHPSTDLTPSLVDLNSYYRHLHDSELEFDHFVSIIVSMSPSTGVAAVAWLIDRNQVRAVPFMIDY
jgi:integrative and conjugative element protein (TIGR02256 family)